MCGLIGAIRADDTTLSKIGHYMWQGLYMSALRGMGGTGVGIVHREFDTDLAKSHVSAPNFLCSEEWDWVDKNVQGARAVLGHTRSATTGTVATKNSHPFRFSDDKNEITLIHNGHIRNHYNLTPVGFSHAVDSAHVAHSILVRGAMETLEILEGAYTLIWYDKKAKSVKMARNDERELFYAFDKEKRCLWFGSEFDMLVCLLRRNGIAHQNKFYTLDTHTLYTFDLTKKVLEPAMEKYEEKKSLPVFQKPSGNDGQNWSGSKENYGNFTKNFPNIGDWLWANVSDDKDVALKLYKPVGDGKNDTVERHNAYGFMYGTRSCEIGSIVRINGISYDDWDTRLHNIKASMPCRITNVSRGMKNSEGKTYTYYECMLIEDEVVKECRRVAGHKKLFDLRQKKSEEHVKAALAAGRSLPVLADESSALDDDGEGCEGSDRGSDVVGPRRPFDTVGLDSDAHQAKFDSLHGDACDVTDRWADDGGAPVNEAFEVSYKTKTCPGPRGTKLTYREWKDISTQGCFICMGKMDDCDIGKVEWWEHPRNPEDRKDEDAEWQMICPECKDDPKAMEKIAAA